MTPSRRSVLLFALLATGACARDPQAAARAFVASADGYVASGEFGKAIIEYRNAIERDEAVAATHYKLGLVYERTGDTDRALAAFIRAAQLDSTHIDAHVHASTALMGRGRYAEAKRLADAVTSIEPRHAQAVALAAAAEAGLGNTAKGTRHLEEALAIQPRFALAHHLFGTALLHRGQLKEARAALQASVDEDGGSATAWADLGRACWALGDFEAAEAAFRRALQADVRSADVRRLLASFYVGTGRADRAEAHLRALAEMNAAGRLALADYYVAAGRSDDAARELELIADKAHVAAVIMRKAIIAHRRGDKPGAYRHLAGLLGDRATAPDAMLVKSELLLLDGDIAGALNEAERSAASRPGWPAASYMAGVIHLIREDAAAGTRWLQRARSEGAEGPAIDLGLARAALMQGDAARATELAQTLVAESPSLQAHLVLARALRATGDLAGARAAVTGARVRWRNAAALDIEEGHVELAAGRPAQARRAFARALERGPTSVQARSGLVASFVAGGDVSTARQRVDLWLASDAGDIQMMLLSARLDAAEGKLAAAERTLLAAQQKAPRDAAVARELSRVSLARGSANDAAAHMARAADNVAHPVAELVALGMLREASADVPGARGAYERALALDPDIGIAANNLAWIYADEGRLREALELAERAERLLRGAPQSLHTLGWMYYRQGMPDRAVPWLQRASAAAPDNPRYRRDLAQASSQLAPSVPTRASH